eukprot:m51a1_g3862 hypothetical protein (239) ;mRNA; f:412306-413022
MSYYPGLPTTPGYYPAPAYPVPVAPAVPVAVPVVLAQPWTPPPVGVCFSIVCEVDRRYALDVQGARRTRGANVIVYAANGDANQLWRIDECGCLQSAHSGLVLDVEGCAPRAGAQAVQWERSAGPTQRWRFYPNGAIALEGTNLFLTVEGCRFANSTRVLAMPCNGGGDSQRWRVVIPGQYQQQQQLGVAAVPVVPVAPVAQVHYYQQAPQPQPRQRTNEIRVTVPGIGELFRLQSRR